MKQSNFYKLKNGGKERVYIVYIDILTEKIEKDTENGVKNLLANSTFSRKFSNIETILNP